MSQGEKGSPFLFVAGAMFEKVVVLRYKYGVKLGIRGGLFY